MTPDKVEEIVKKFENEIISVDELGHQAHISDAYSAVQWLRTTLTQYHQDLMSEVVEEIKNFDHNDIGLCRCSDAPQKCECYYGGIETAQNIIKSK